LGVQKWLQATFYDRYKDELGKSVSSTSKCSLYLFKVPNNRIVTFMLSAFWHGFYPSYYLLFVMYHFGMEVQRLMFKNQLLIKGRTGTFRYYTISVLEQ
jgi:hypothetical protein